MECIDKAKLVLEKNSRKIGVCAGDYYPDMWFRDSLISCLGLCASRDQKMLEIARNIIDTASAYQKPTGQIPNKIDPKGEKVCFGAGGCVDSSMWYPIAVLEYYKATKDKKFLLAHYYKIEKAIYWVHCQDANDDCLLETNEGSDWSDVLVRHGRVLYDNILFYKAMKDAQEIRNLLGMDEKYAKAAEDVKNSINLLMWPKHENLEKVRKKYSFSGIDKDFEIALRNGERSCYLADLGFRKFDPRTDVYSNTLAILFGVSDKEQTRHILEHFKKEHVWEPYPIRVLTPPIYNDDKFRYFYFRETDLPYLQEPGNYHNGAVWPFAGGFYIAMLKKLGVATNELEKKLIEANECGKGFHEWISASGQPAGSANQTWSAAMLIYAMKCKF